MLFYHIHLSKFLLGKKNYFTRKTIFYFAAIPAFIFLGFGFFLHFSEGLKNIKLSFLRNETANLLDNLEKQKIEREQFWGYSPEDPFPIDNKKKILFFGDSIANDLYMVASRSQTLSKVANFRQLFLINECLEIINNDGNLKKKIKRGCENYAKNLKSSQIQEAQLVVLAFSWLPSYVIDLENLLKTPSFRDKVIILYQMPAFAPIDSLIMETDKKGFSISDEAFQRFIFQNKFGKTVVANSLVQKISEKFSVEVLDGYSAFCIDKLERCSLFSSYGDPYLIDSGHLSKAGLIKHEKWFSKELLRILNQ